MVPPPAPPPPPTTADPSVPEPTAILPEDDEDEDFGKGELQIPAKPYTAADLDPQERATFETMSKDEQKRYLDVQNHFKAILESEEMSAVTDEEAKAAASEIQRSGIVPLMPEERNLAALKDGFWQEDEDDEFGQVPDDDDETTDDMITSVAESELEVHREIREYTRIAAWDLPLLLRGHISCSLPVLC